MNDYYDNLQAYEYDDYVEKDDFNEDAYEDYLLQRKLDEMAETFDALDYESKMAEQLINDINDKM